MKTNWILLLLLLSWLTDEATGLAQTSDAPLPDGVKAVWTLDQAFREHTSTQERGCLNSLWR